MREAREMDIMLLDLEKKMMNCLNLLRKEKSKQNITGILNSMIKEAGSLDNLIDLWVDNDQFQALEFLTLHLDIPDKQKDKINKYLVAAKLSGKIWDNQL